MSIQINPKIEKVLEEKIFPELERGRKNFDLPHTKAVVYWMKQLLTDPKLTAIDTQVLITSAYAHDWGYVDLFKDSDSDDPKEISLRKPMHMDIGAQRITTLLQTDLRNFFSSKQIALTAHLVQVHDALSSLKTDEEILIMEADTLGMLDTDRVLPTFTKQENDAFISTNIRAQRLPLFRHQFALQVVDELILKRQKFYQ